MNALSITSLETGPDGGGWRATATVGRHRVEIRATHPLTASAEALASAFLLPAMARGADLAVAEPLCPRWRANVTTVRDLARQWWGYRNGAVHGPEGAVLDPLPDTALMFGGGVDSIFSLVTRMADIRYLVFVQGYDVPLADAERLARIDDWNRRLAAEAGKELIILRANLRSLPEFRVAPWAVAHGGALAAAAHLLAGLAGRFLLPSSQPPWVDHPWGSCPALDHAWSSSAMTLECHGAEQDRFGKVQGIAQSPLAHRYLRVCWRHTSDDLNCGVCEKCVRTQVAFLAAGALDRLRTFPPGSLVARLDALPGVAALVERNYLEVMDHLPADVRRSVQALLARSPAWRRRDARRQSLVDLARKLRWRFR
ncbi:MAG: hypothetical protein H6907_15320 [Hyphomicrobiales bacterium]|nr:hypothetical protein [Hyphomicrobiales bacterium]MCP5373095.1 hypothetical protein [Hyphomicrobiales bacterium]